MKPLFLTLLLHIAFASTSFAQMQDTSRNKHEKRDFLVDKCWATSHGKNAMVFGGVVTAIGIALYKYEVHKEPYVEHWPVTHYVGFFPMMIGAPILVAGTIMFGIGKAHDAHRRNYYSLVSSGNSLGLAYNF